MTSALGAKRDFKKRLHAELSRIDKAVSSPHRLVILDLLLGVRPLDEYSAGHVYADKAVSLSNANGLRAQRLTDGFRSGVGQDGR